MTLKDFKDRDRRQTVTLDHPFVRFTLLNKQLLVVSMHHVLFDFWSHRFLYDDVAKLYLGMDPVIRQPLRKFINHLQHDEMKTANKLWSSYLDHVQPSILNPLPSAKNLSGSRDLGLDVKAFTRALGVTSGSLIYTAWAIILARHIGLQEAVFATAIAGREMPIDQITTLDGPTLTIVPQKIIVSPKASLGQAVRSVHDSFWEVLKYSQYGMRQALTASGPSV